MMKNTRRNITCCKGCAERHEACHDKCERYREQKAELNAANTERQEAVNQMLGYKAAKRRIKNIAIRREKNK